MQIRTKLTFSFIFITASLLLVAFVSIYIISARNREVSLTNFLRKKVVSRADLLIKVNKVDVEVVKIIDRYKKDVFPYEKIAIYDRDFRLLYTNNDSIHFENFIGNEAEVCRKIERDGEFKLTAKEMELVCLPYGYQNEKYYLIAGAKDLHGRASLENLGRTLVFVYVVFLSFLGYFGWIYAKRALKPISTVMNQVDLISGSNLSDRLNIGPNRDEITRLTQTFNQLLDRVEKAVQLQRNFVSNASHELGNPLTSITTQLEVSLLSKRSNEAYEETLKSILEDIKNLSAISRQLLTLSRLQNGDKIIMTSNIRLDELLWDVRSAYLEKNKEAEIHFQPDNLPENEKLLCIEGNEPLLKTCFNNLIDNAIKFSFDRRMEIQFVLSAGKIDVNFVNRGIRILEKDLDHIFEPFYRSEQSTAIRGNGIGLSIVKNIAEVHQATLKVESLENETTRFTLSFKSQTF